MVRFLALAALLGTLSACGGGSNTIEVEVDNSTYDMIFGPQPGQAAE